MPGDIGGISLTVTLALPGDFAGMADYYLLEGLDGSVAQE